MHHDVTHRGPAQRECLDVELERLPRFGGRGGCRRCRGLGAGFGERVQVAGPIRVHDHHDGGGNHGDFLDVDLAADDVHQAVTQAHLGNRYERLRAGGLDL